MPDHGRPGSTTRRRRSGSRTTPPRDGRRAPRATDAATRGGARAPRSPRGTPVAGRRRRPSRPPPSAPRAGERASPGRAGAGRGRPRAGSAAGAIGEAGARGSGPAGGSSRLADASSSSQLRPASSNAGQPSRRIVAVPSRRSQPSSAGRRSASRTSQRGSVPASASSSARASAGRSSGPQIGPCRSAGPLPRKRRTRSGRAVDRYSGSTPSSRSSSSRQTVASSGRPAPKWRHHVTAHSQVAKMLPDRSAAAVQSSRIDSRSSTTSSVMPADGTCVTIRRGRERPAASAGSRPPTPRCGRDPAAARAPVPSASATGPRQGPRASADLPACR